MAIPLAQNGKKKVQAGKMELYFKRPFVKRFTASFYWEQLPRSLPRRDLLDILGFP